MNASIFHNFPKFEPKLAQVKANFWKIGRLCSKICPKLDRLVYEWVTFLEKLVFVLIYFQISRLHVPTKIKLEYPPPRGPESWWYMQVSTSNSIAMVKFKRQFRIELIFKTYDPSIIWQVEVTAKRIHLIFDEKVIFANGDFFAVRNLSAI